MAFHLAQLNVARLLHPLDHPQIKEFIDGLDHINALAEQWPRFVWRLQTDSGNATDIRHPRSQDPFTYYLKRSHWFEKPIEAHYALWWVRQGHIPSLEEARDRLEHYRANGASPHAFWFDKLFPAPEVSAALV